jgi:GxxExxY protein
MLALRDAELTRSPYAGEVETNVITGEIVRAAMTVHSALGPGLLESAYRICLAHELTKRGLQVIQEKPVQIRYDGVILCTAFRADLLVEGRVLVELKAVEKMRSLYQSQLLSYLKLSELRTGLLINFNVRHLRHGIKRMVR